MDDEAKKLIQELRSEIHSLRQDVNWQFDSVNQRFDSVDQRFDAVDEELAWLKNAVSHIAAHTVPGEVQESIRSGDSKPPRNPVITSDQQVAG